MKRIGNEVLMWLEEQREDQQPQFYLHQHVPGPDSPSIRATLSGREYSEVCMKSAVKPPGLSLEFYYLLVV